MVSGWVRRAWRIALGHRPRRSCRRLSRPTYPDVAPSWHAPQAGAAMRSRSSSVSPRGSRGRHGATPAWMARTTRQSAVLSLSLTSSRPFCYAGTIVPWDRASREEVLAMATAEPVSVERVQLGVRMEKRMVKVLKGLAEFNGVTLGQLLEKIVLHSFEPVPGQEGEMA